MSRSTKQNGFTLVELSIVLVIIGLLVGGVLAGQALIRAAELRSVSTQIMGYITAVRTFQDKYQALPGDMPNAVKYWGAADGSTGMTNACGMTITNDARTCNGDGDGKMTIPAYSYEHFRFWQQLANAGLIEGQYTGAPDNAHPYSSSPGINAPRSRLRTAYWNVRSIVVPYNDGDSLRGNYDNHFQFGTPGPINGLWNDGYALKPEEAYNIDIKIDDGKPGSGFMGTNWNGCTTGTNSLSYDAIYQLSNSATSCLVRFMWQGTVPREF